MSNVGALQQVVDYLRAHPDKHNQGEWVCGTTGCIAGWAVALANLTDISTLGAVGIEEEARRLLGLTDREAYALFISTAGWSDNCEARALELADALIARDKDNGALTSRLRAVLRRYDLPQWQVTA